MDTHLFIQQNEADRIFSRSTPRFLMFSGKSVDTVAEMWYIKCCRYPPGGMADTGDLKSPGSDTVPVRVRSPAPSGFSEYRGVEQLAARRAHNPEVAGSSPASATRSSVHNQPESWMWTLDFFAYICVSLISGYSTSLAHDPVAPAFSRNPQQPQLHIFAAIAENRHTADEEGQAHPPSPVTKLNSWRMYIDESNWDRAAHR